jgi:glycosyltransferase involved in cell wall biosynthesis
MILAANEDTATFARRLGSRNVVLFSDTGIDSSIVRLNGARHWEAPDLRVVWVGRMFPRKGVGLALHAVAKVIRRIPVRMTLIGDGPEDARLRKMSQSLGIDRYLEWTGRIPWADVISALDDAHLLIFPSIRETGAVQPLEAMARGLPVLTLDHQGMRNQVPTRAAIKVPVRSPRQVIDDLADAMVELFHDRDRLRAMSAEGLRYAREQTWDVRAERMEEIYRELLRMHSPTASHASNA